MGLEINNASKSTSGEGTKNVPRSDTSPPSPTPYIRLKSPTVGDFPYEWQPWHRVASVYTSAWQADGEFGLVADLTSRFEVKDHKFILLTLKPYPLLSSSWRCNSNISSIT
ncbi:hypothetical protein E2C01_014504 [Portunus trituberculatus]|uniref:Uncharacterized protein n=1 Tax=Portunus trituberculatus TaxID=210409 RepID=A0A5B7DKM8_PORTR|nr:hypothetical protein [Portunus trituberculatus]